jgi:predicted MFS family arabinose efflux permease
VVGGALYGGWGAARASRDYGLAAALVALASAPAILGGSQWPVAVSLFAAGFALAPMLGCGYRLVDRLAPQGMATEAFAWTSTAFGAGEALGCPLAGSLIDARGATAAFALSVAAAAIGALVIVLRRRTLAPAAAGARPGLRPTTIPQPQEA